MEGGKEGVNRWGLSAQPLSYLVSYSQWDPSAVWAVFCGFRYKLSRTMV